MRVELYLQAFHLHLQELHLVFQEILVLILLQQMLWQMLVRHFIHKPQLPQLRILNLV